MSTNTIAADFTDQALTYALILASGATAKHKGDFDAALTEGILRVLAIETQIRADGRYVVADGPSTRVWLERGRDGQGWHVQVRVTPGAHEEAPER